MDILVKKNRICYFVVLSLVEECIDLLLVIKRILNLGGVVCEYECGSFN